MGEFLKPLPLSAAIALHDAKRSVKRCHPERSEGSQLIHTAPRLTSIGRWNSIWAAGGKTKNPPCQSARRVSETSGKLYQLFSSFLRGASCPKSPRVAATAAASFMLEKQGDVKRNHLAKIGDNILAVWRVKPMDIRLQSAANSKQAPPNPGPPTSDALSAFAEASNWIGNRDSIL